VTTSLFKATNMLKRDSTTTSPGFTPSNSDEEQPKKKLGRKVSNQPANTKRIAQNRIAQRAFRERKENHLKELESRIKELEEANQKAGTLQLLNENKALRYRIAQLQGENAALKDAQFTFNFQDLPTAISNSSGSSNIGDMSISATFSNQLATPVLIDGMSSASILSHETLSSLPIHPSATTPPVFPSSPYSDAKSNPFFQLQLQNSSTNFSDYRDISELDVLINSMENNQASDLTYAPLLDPIDDIDNLLNTDDFDLAMDSKTDNQPPKSCCEDGELKERVKRVVQDPAEMLLLCKMFSSNATCSEFIKVKERIAIAIINEQSQEVSRLVKESNKV